MMVRLTTDTMICLGDWNSCLEVLTGYYSVPLDVSVNVRQNESECDPGYFCVGGVRAPCPSGEYQNEPQQTACKSCECPTGLNATQLCANAMGPSCLGRHRGYTGQTGEPLDIPREKDGALLFSQPLFTCCTDGVLRVLDRTRPVLVLFGSLNLTLEALSPFQLTK
jgi:hypothetical protein